MTYQSLWQPVEPIDNYGSDEKTNQISPLKKTIHTPRCGGCCSHPLLACQPLQTEILQRQVEEEQKQAFKRGLRFIQKPFKESRATMYLQFPKQNLKHY